MIQIFVSGRDPWSTHSVCFSAFTDESATSKFETRTVLLSLRSPHRQALIFLSASACSLSSFRARCGLPARIAPKRRSENLAKKSVFAPAIHRRRWFSNAAHGCPLVGRPDNKKRKTLNCSSACFFRGRCAPHSGECSTRQPRCGKM